MTANNTSPALKPAFLWERLRQAVGLPGEWDEAPVEARALIMAVTGAFAAEDIIARCEEAGAALIGDQGALEARLDDLQRWSDALAAILDEYGQGLDRFVR